METKELYREILNEHNLNPTHKKEMADADFSLNGVNPSCGDNITLNLKASQFLQQGAGNTISLIDDFGHVYRNTNGTGLVRNGTGDSLTNPPGCIGTEFISLVVIKLVYGFDKT